MYLLRVLGFYVCPWWWCWNADIMFLMTLGSKVHISLGLFTGTVLRLDIRGELVK